MLELIPLITFSIIAILVLAWLKRKSGYLREAIRYHIIASGIHNLSQVQLDAIPKERVEPKHRAEALEEPTIDSEKIVRVIFGYGGLIKHALEMESFTTRELARIGNIQDMLVNAWIRDCLELGVLEEYEDRYTGEVRYRIKKEKIEELSAEIYTQIQKLRG